MRLGRSDAEPPRERPAHASIRDSHRIGLPLASFAQLLPYLHLLKTKPCNNKTPQSVEKYRLHLATPT
jgi:hypothetical protein